MVRRSVRFFAGALPLLLLLAFANVLYAQGGCISSCASAPELDPGLTASGVVLLIGAAAWISSVRKR